jgi:hypothetical protein
MTTEDGELLSRLLDREPVDPAALARVLDDPEGRRTLVAFAALRDQAQSPAPGEAEWTARQKPLPTRRVRVWRAVAAAALLVMAVTAGMYVERQRNREAPPEPARVVQLEPLSI